MINWKNKHYGNRYEKLIQYRKNNIINVDFEKHHIIPRFLDGVDDKTNMVNLSFREHYIAHYLLAKGLDDNAKAWFSFNMMNRLRTAKKHKLNKSSLYEYNKKKLGTFFAKLNKGYHTYKDKDGELIRLKTDDPSVLSGEFVSMSCGRSPNENTRKKMSYNRKGKTHREYTKKLMSENGIKDKIGYYHKDTLKTRFFNKDAIIPDDYIKGISDDAKKILSDSGGKMWYYHKETFKNKRFTEGDVIPDCYIKGRYGMVNRNIFGIFCKACDVMMPPSKEMWYSYQEKQILRGEKASAIKREKYGTFNPIVKK